MIKKIYLLFIIVSILVTSLQSQSKKDNRSTLDTLKNTPVLDTLKNGESIHHINDSVMVNNFISNYYFNDSIWGQNIKHSDIMRTDYLSFSDLLKSVSGYFVADYGNPGMYNPVFYQGLPPTNTSILVDGIPFGNSFFGYFEQCLITMEDIERVEIISPIQSVAYGNVNVINIVTNKKNSRTPITYVRHSEAAYDTYLTDVFFTSNITEVSNVYVGFNYHMSDGRFSNSDYSYFGGKVRYRNVISDKLELNISDYFSKLDRGFHGGVKLTSEEVTNDIFDERIASVLFPSAKQNYFRNIVSAQLAGYFLNDSLQSSLLTISFNTEENIFKDAKALNSSVINIDVPIKTNILSVIAKQNVLLDNQLLSFYLRASSQNTKDFLFLNSEFDSMYYNSNGRNNKIYFSLVDRIKFSDIFELSLSGMYLIWNNKYESEALSSRLNFGINPSLRINDFVFSTGFVWGNREPFSIETFYPLSSVEYFYQSMKESKNFNKLFADVGFKSACYNLQLAMYRSWLDKQTLFEFNNIAFPISMSEFDVLQDIENMGFSINGDFRFGKFELESNINYNHYNNNLIKRIIPELFCYFGIYYESKLISDNINLRVGLNGNYYSQFSILPNIVNLHNENLQATKYYSPNGVINFVSALTIQTATIYINVNNLFNTNYFITKTYPMNDRNFQLSVCWSFLD